MGQRRRGREYALQLLFQMDLSGGSPEDQFQDFWEGLEVPGSVREFAEKLVRGTWNESDSLDEEIGRAAVNWRMDRMATVDRNVLRMATWEMLFDRDTPAAVIIDEAIEIARKFGSEDSGGFINGILDSIKDRKLPGGV
ncbi:MAG: transcription antitermination factor NusB [Acidobacteria bacterium]|uniref:Transcription antitermination protein NusB n=1 Tax=Candidatus Polarisedimenticola svalbardensis TaxID=2886004 RepID=A0A8J7CK23_9BACT|nr:transcription antitermination factor NusB [Candidatus Polarisedimenticola svalbardensis]